MIVVAAVAAGKSAGSMLYQVASSFCVLTLNIAVIFNFLTLSTQTGALGCGGDEGCGAMTARGQTEFLHGELPGSESGQFRVMWPV